MNPPLPTAQPSDELIMKTEFIPPAAEEISFHPPPNPAVPDQCQNAPDTESTAQASVELTAETAASFFASGPESPAIINDQEKPPQKSATAVPPLPPTAKPAFAFGAVGGPKETPKRSAAVAEGIKFQDDPSKCSIVPEFPTAQALLEFNRASPFRLSLVEAQGSVCAVDHGTAIRRERTNKSETILITRKFLIEHLSVLELFSYLLGFAKLVM